MTRPQGLFQTHVPGRSVVHRTPLWLKFLGVLLVGASTFWITDWRQSAAVAGVVLTVHLLSGLGLRRLGHSLRPLLPLFVVLGAFQWWSHDLAYAARVVLGIMGAFVAAGLLTATTSMERILDGVVSASRPLRRWVDPETVALTIAVMLRSIPWITGAFSDVRDSARARGLERSPRAVLLPVVIHTVATPAPLGTRWPPAVSATLTSPVRGRPRRTGSRDSTHERRSHGTAGSASRVE